MSSMVTMKNLEALYYFSSVDYQIVEVKRNDLPASAPSSARYHWLVMPTDLNACWGLDFVSMKEGHRLFRAGELTFGDTRGEFTIWGQRHELVRHSVEAIPQALMLKIQSHLDAPRPHADAWGMRPLRPSDVEHFHRWVFDPSVVRYSMTQFHRMRSAADVTRWFQTTLRDPRCWQRGIVEPQSGDLIGYAGLAAINEIDGNAEYFIFIGEPRHWGKGIATDVTGEVAHVGFEELKLHRIFLTASAANAGALRAYAKAGFREEGRLREAFFRGGEHSDKIIMGLLRSEWRQP